ncbi:MAG: hypothetical protein GX555_12525 [Actinomycetales bacterium]|nr:hypothetical protein [Actinomycetales bacterium]
MINVGLQLRFTVSGVTREELRLHVDAVMDQLLVLEEAAGAVVHSGAVSLDLGSSKVTIELVGVGETFDEAQAAADGAVRTAIHVAGGHTPGWNREGEPTYERDAVRAELIDA